MTPARHSPPQEAANEGPLFDDLRAVFVNCTLKRSPEVSNTGGLIDLSSGIMQSHGVAVETLRAIDHEIATGLWPDMTEHGWQIDESPAIYDRVLAIRRGHTLPEIMLS